jgi:hypothetical protein
MSRPPRGQEVLDDALRALASATTIEQLRQAQAVVLPLQYGMSLEQTALDERETISRGLASCKSLRRISQELGRSASTISREVARNGGSEKYRACQPKKLFSSAVGAPSSHCFPKMRS